MLPTQLLSQYGYMAVFAGSILEGETILILAGFAAHQGYLLIAGSGFLFGQPLEWLFTDIKQYEKMAVILVVVVMVVFGSVRWLRLRRQ